jgi:serine/threonine protein kinase
MHDHSSSSSSDTLSPTETSSHKRQRVVAAPSSASHHQVIRSATNGSNDIIMIEQTKSFDPLLDDNTSKMKIETSPTAATSSASSVTTEDYSDDAAIDGTSTHRLVSAPYDETETATYYAIPMAPLISPTVSDTRNNMLPTPPSSPPPVCVTGKFANIEHKYHIDPKVLGTGHHGSVRRCINRSTRQRLAVKSIRKSDPSVKIGSLHREIILLQQMKHSSIIQLVDVFEDEEYLHLVTELCEGGELFDKIVERANSRSKEEEDDPEEDAPHCFSEQEAARVLHEILIAIRYMHQHGIVHRDIKPENILFTSKEEGSPIKIIDFGLARKFNPREDMSMSTVVGTPYYIAPEVLRKDYDASCDLWSVGIIAYILLCGYPPFNGADNAAVYAAVRKGTYYFPSSDWKGVSYDARDFIRRLLQVNVTKRMSVEQALRHPWLVHHTAATTSAMEDEQREDMVDASSVEVVLRRGYHGSSRDVVFCGQNQQQQQQMALSPPRINLK